MKRLAKTLSWLTMLSLIIFISCQKQVDKPNSQQQSEEAGAANNGQGHLQQTKTYSSEVVNKWIDMQLRLMQTSSPFIGGLPVSRVFGYTGIALYESVVPGMPAYQSL